MEREPVTFRPDQTLGEVEEVLGRCKITGAPVVEGDKPVGVISRTDLVRQLELERSRFEAANQSFDPFDRDDPFTSPVAVSTAIAKRWLGLKVKDAMHHAVVEVSPGEPLAAAARKMVENRVHRLAVTEGGRLVGTVSTLDLLRAMTAGEEPAA